MMTELKVTDSVITKYANQSNVIHGTKSTLNYGMIRIMTDADQDGNDIQCLLIQFLSHWPQLFLQNRVRKLNTPILIFRKKKKEPVYFYTLHDYESYDKSKLKGYSMEYIKGLGSLTTKDYKNAIIEPNDTIITYDNNARSSLDLAFSGDSNVRKTWLLE